MDKFDIDKTNNIASYTYDYFSNELDKLIIKSKIATILNKLFYILLASFIIVDIPILLGKINLFEGQERDYLILLLYISILINGSVLYMIINLMHKNKGPGDILLYDVPFILNDAVNYILDEDINNNVSLEDFISDIATLNRKIIKIKTNGTRYIKSDIIIPYLIRYPEFNNYCLIYAAINNHEIVYKNGKKQSVYHIIKKYYEDEYNLETYPFIFTIDMLITKLNESANRYTCYNNDIELYIKQKFYTLHLKEVDATAYALIDSYKKIKEKHAKMIEEMS